LSRVAPGVVIVRARFIGYVPAFDTVSVAAGDSVEASFVLRPSVTDGLPFVVLGPVVVTAAKRSQLLDQAITSVAVVSDTELARRAVNTVDEAVDKAPGVQFLYGQVNIRGSTGYVQGLGSRVLMLVDGVPANQGDRGGINWDLVPLEDVQRVEIVKGAGSSLYGSAALGGVVNVLTRDIAPGFHARVRATGGSYANPPYDVWRFRDYAGAEEGLDATGSYGTELVRASVTGGGWHSDGYREQDRRDHWQTAAKLDWRPLAAMRVTASGSWASDQYETPLIWCTRGGCDDRGQAYQPFMIDTAGRGAFTRSDKGYVSLTLERTASARLAWQARGSWLRTRFNDYQPGNDDAGIANRFGAELRALAHPAEGRVVTVGAEGARADVTSDIFGDHAQNEVAAYGESEQRVGRARLTAGARIDYIAVDGGGLSAVVSPRVGAVLETSAGAWRASAGRGFRGPSLAERFVSTVVSGLVVIPNPDLHPETAWSFELGNAARIAPAVHADAALFWTEAHDLIEPNVNLSTGQIQFRNVARARLAGLDVSGSYGTELVRASVTGGGWHSDGYREQDRRDHWQTAAKLDWRPLAAMRVTASGSWASDQYETPLIWCTRGGCDDRGQAYQPFMIDTAGRGAFTRSDKGYVSLTLERTASARLAWQARGSWLRTRFNDYQPGNDDAGIANRFGAELRALAHPAEGRVVTVGAEGARADVTSDIFGDHAQNEVAAYGESEQRVGRARLTAGARIDYIAVDGGGLSAVVSPRVGAVLETSAGAWRASAGRGFRGPSLAERFVSTVVSGLVVIPNPDLHPETAWSFELGNAARIAPAVHADAALFWTEAHDLIEPNVNLSTGQIQFRNVARARLAGLDVSLAASPLTPRLTTALAYTFLYARGLAHDTVPERPLAFRPT
ncbi:MAG: hypothetical protein DMD55_20050, partial [Gemmatimonadetes bacterium]